MSLKSVLNKYRCNNKNEEIIEEIRKTNKLIRFNKRWFDDEKNYDLIENCIYQREILFNKYDNLINEAKKNYITNNPKLGD